MSEALTEEEVRRNLDLSLAMAVGLPEEFWHVVIIWETFGQERTWRGYLVHDYERCSAEFDAFLATTIVPQLRRDWRPAFIERARYAARYRVEDGQPVLIR